MSVVVHAILNIYQDLLRVKFVEFTGDAQEVWHPGDSLASLVWESEVLKKMSNHCKTQEPLSDDLIAMIINR